MELYNYHSNNSRQRHYKSKSAAAVSCLSHSKIFPFRPRTETTETPNATSNVILPRPHHMYKQHYKNNKKNLIKPSKKKSKISRNRDRNRPKSHHPPYIRLPIQHSKKTHYNVPTNTPQKTQKSHAKTHKKHHKNNNKHVHNHQFPSSPPLSLLANAYTIYPSLSSTTHTCTNSSNCKEDMDMISNIGVHNISFVSDSLTTLTTPSLIDCSLRMLASVSSISSVSHHTHLQHCCDNLSKLGIPIVYIHSFEAYFGATATQLGHGGQGSIYKINESHVIKSYNATSLGLYREIFALKHILGKQIELYIEKSKNRKAYIKFPLIRGENLMEYSQDLINNKKTSLRECHLQALFAQLFVSLYSLHSKGLIHRDIKIENVMVKQDGSIEFIDFGHAIYIAKDLNSERYRDYKLQWIKGTTEIFGTDCVLCPELKYAFYAPQLRNGQCITYGTEIDFYSIGIMGVEIIYNIFDHSYQHYKWIKLLKKDIANHGNLSGLSVKCLTFLLALIDTNPSNRLKMNEILSHPFLTEEVIDKLGYDNWYSSDTDNDNDSISEDDDIPDLPLQSIEMIVKEELIKHKISIICKALLDEKLSYYPRIQHLNKLIGMIKECEIEKDTTYPHIASFVVDQFEIVFDFQLKNYNPNKTAHNIEKINKKKISLHKKLYQVIIEFVTNYKKEFIVKLENYVNIMIEFNDVLVDNDHFIACMYRIINRYSSEYNTCLILLQIINKNVKQMGKSVKSRNECLSFLKFILQQKYNETFLHHPQMVKLIESTIKHGLIDRETKPGSELLLKTFKLLQINKIHTIKTKTNKNKHFKKNKSVDITKINALNAPLPPSKINKNKSLDICDKKYKKGKRKRRSNSDENIIKSKRKNKRKKVKSRIRIKFHNKNGMVTESYSEIPHFDDICASANDQSL